MTPIYFTVDRDLPIMVIPNVKVHMDGHTVLAYTYHIFYDSVSDNPASVVNNTTMISNKLSNPDYFGFITFEDPDRLFSFTPEGNRELTRTELEEIIEQIKHYRDNPSLWKQN
jgi:hypothetical protein